MKTEAILVPQPARVPFAWDKAMEAAALIEREWLVTNCLGGYASGTLAGIGTRRYHGVFIPNLENPWGRTMMIPRLDDSISVPGGRSYLLGGAEYGRGVREGDSHLVLREFQLDRDVPVWNFAVEGRVLQKRLVMMCYQNTVFVEYRLLSGKPLRLKLRPFVTFRGHDAPFQPAAEEPFRLKAHKKGVEVSFFVDAPPLKLAAFPFLPFVDDRAAHEGVFYPIERARGLDDLETQVSPGYFETELRAGSSAAFTASVEPWENLNLEPDAVFDAEAQRIDKLLALTPPSLKTELGARYAVAASQFVVLPASRREESVLLEASGEHLRSVIAGYHWFTDWGRDTMISLEGLTLTTGRFEEARAILKTFSNYVKDGLLPNQFPEGNRTAFYNTADATLWFFHAMDRYFQYTCDCTTLGALYPVFKSIIEHHQIGTHFGIGMDPDDGLLRAGAPGYALTWMDAHVEDWVVTPRRGKPVEVQALWYNALRLIDAWSVLLDERQAGAAKLADRVYASFNEKFWDQSGQYLYDVIDGDPAEKTKFRPNQIFSVSLRFPVLKEERWRSVVEGVADRLLTPVGLRTLDPRDPAYQPRYEGGRRARDAAYHQGLVWAWLIGPFIDAWRKIYPQDHGIGRFLSGFENHLSEEGVGTISEIFDAEAPFKPRGCIAQAWSVAEVLRSYATSRGHFQTTEDSHGFPEASSRGSMIAAPGGAVIS